MSPASYVLLHGFNGDPEVWTDVRATLPAEARVLAPALAGHLDVPPPVHFEGEVDRIARLADERGFRGAHLAGYSMGGRLTIGLLVRHPGLFPSATIIGANPGLRSEEARRARSAQDDAWAALVERDGVEAFIEKWESQPLFASQRGIAPALLDRQRASRRRHTTVGLAAAMRNLGLAVMPDYWEALRELGAVVRFMAGELDAKFTSLAREMVALVPRAELTIVPGVGHNVVLEAPDAVAAALMSPTTTK